MVENNVKENLIDDEEELYVNLNDLVDLRESAELKEAADAFECYLEDYALATGMPQSVLSDICPVCTGSTQGNGILLYERVRDGCPCNEERTGRGDDGGGEAVNRRQAAVS